MGAPGAFPLDAEQIVRLTGAVLAEALNAVRHADSKPVDADRLTLALGEAAGVPLPTEGDGFNRCLLPYGALTPPSPVDRQPQELGGSREA